MLHNKKALTNYGIQITGTFAEALSKGNNIIGELELLIDLDKASRTSTFVHARKGKVVYPELLTRNLEVEVVPEQVFERNLPVDHKVIMGTGTPVKTAKNIVGTWSTSGSGTKKGS